MNIGEKIKSLRLAAKLTQEELASAAGTTKQTIHKYETGIISNIPASKVKAIADRLNTTPAYLMGWEEKHPRPNITDDHVTFPTIEDIAVEHDHVAVKSGDGGTVDIHDFYLRSRKQSDLLEISKSDLLEDKAKNGSNLFPYNPVIHKIPILGYISAGLPLYADEHIEGYTYTEHNGGAEYFALKIKGDSMSAAQINDGNTIIVRKQSTVENGEIAVVRVNSDDATVKRFKIDGNMVQLIPQSFNPEHQVQIYDLKKTKIEILGKVIECKIEF